MKELSLSQSYALIALNAQDSINMTTSKKVALRAIAAAVVLQCYLNKVLNGQWQKKFASEPVCADTELYEELVLRPLSLLKMPKGAGLAQWLTAAAHMPQAVLKKLECGMSDALCGANVLEQIPNLLGCDMLYVTAGLAIKEYRADEKTYMKITEELRANVLEDCELSDEDICMLWLMRESFCFYDVFSGNELEKVKRRIVEACQKNGLAQALFSVNIHRGPEAAIKGFLQKKKILANTPNGQALNFVFPFLERSQSVFIDDEKWFSNAADRLADVTARLSEKGHSYTVLHEGQIPLIKIDNIIYSCYPYTINQRIPIQGVRLVRNLC
ncbi:MAG: hypothetical protein RSB36_07900 [Hydrogenoanaerobacterium sp.]